MEEPKDIKLLRRLDYEAEKQKKRVLQLMELDCKKIGIRIIAEHTGLKIAYLYNIFSGKNVISIDKTIKLFYKVKEVTEMLNV